MHADQPAFPARKLIRRSGWYFSGDPARGSRGHRPGRGDSRAGRLHELTSLVSAPNAPSRAPHGKPFDGQHHRRCRRRGTHTRAKPIWSARRRSRASRSCSKARSSPTWRRAAPGCSRCRRPSPSSTPAPRSRRSEWRREYSLVLGLERFLAMEPPTLLDGAELNEHQVDALSGTLAALITEVEEGVEPERQRRTAPTARRRAAAGEPSEAENGDRERRRGRWTTSSSPTRSHRTGRTSPTTRTTRSSHEAPEDPGESTAVLVRARDRRRQDRRRGGLRRGVADRRHPDPHPPPQPRRPVHRRDLRPRLQGPPLAAAPRTATTTPTARSPSRPTSGSSATTSEISDAYSIVICDEAHTALGEKTSACIRDMAGPGLHRHDRDRRADRPPRRRPLPHPDLALRPRPGGAARRDRAASLHAHPARARASARWPRCRFAAARWTRTSTRRSWPSSSTRARSTSRSPTSTNRASGGSPASSTPPGVKHANNVAAALRDVGINARAVSGETPKRELAEILAAFERGDVDVLCNAMLLAEGWNSPRATICMHLAPTASRRVYQQRVGRVTRRAPGKEAGLVIDFVHPATTSDETIVTLHSPARPRRLPRRRDRRRPGPPRPRPARAGRAPGRARSRPIRSAASPCSSASSGGSPSRT